MGSKQRKGGKNYHRQLNKLGQQTVKHLIEGLTHTKIFDCGCICKHDISADSETIQPCENHRKVLGKCE